MRNVLIRKMCGAKNSVNERKRNENIIRGFVMWKGWIRLVIKRLYSVMLGIDHLGD